MLQYREIEQLALERHCTLQLEAQQEHLRKVMSGSLENASRYLALRCWIGGQLVRWGTHLQGGKQPVASYPVAGKRITSISLR